MRLFGLVFGCTFVGGLCFGHFQRAFCLGGLGGVLARVCISIEVGSLQLCNMHRLQYLMLWKAYVTLSRYLYLY